MSDQEKPQDHVGFLEVISGLFQLALGLSVLVAIAYGLWLGLAFIVAQFVDTVKSF